MPRKAKEKVDENEIIDEKKVLKKKATTSKKSTSKKDDTAKEAEKKSATKSTTKKTSSKSDTEKKSTTKKAPSKSSTEKKSPSKSTSKKTTTRKKSTKNTDESEESTVQITEYYDLPYKYGNTIVKLLAQTPNTLFVYWEVSDADIKNFKKSYGDDFFIKTKPILIIHNLTLNTSYEVEINDFANCWYLNTEDSDCKYDIELGRKFINSLPQSDSNELSENTPDYIYISTSNNLQSPNDHILFEKLKEFAIFRNVSNDNIIKKNIKSFKFLRDIYKFYKDMYKEEIMNNPSSKFNF